MKNCEIGGGGNWEKKMWCGCRYSLHDYGSGLW